MSDDKILKTIDTPRGKIDFREGEIKGVTSFNDKLSELPERELVALKSDAERCKGFVSKYSDAKKQRSDLLDELDVAFSVWLTSEDRNKEPAGDVIRMLGASYGMYCIDHLGVRWAIVEDSLGTEIALVKDDPPARGFPFSSIKYRIEDKKTDFIGALFEGLKHAIESVKK